MRVFIAISVDSFERVVVVSGVLGLFASLLLRGLSVILGFSSPVIMLRLTFYYNVIVIPRCG